MSTEKRVISKTFFPGAWFFFIFRKGVAVQTLASQNLAEKLNMSFLSEITSNRLT